MSKLLPLFVFALIAINSFGATKQTIANGSWFDPDIWLPSGVPLNEDTVIVNHDVTVNGNYVDFGAEWLIVNSNASIIGDTIFSLHGNLKLFGQMDLRIIAVGDGDSTQVYGTVTGRKYIPGNPYNFNYTGTILSDSLILGDRFENFGNVNVGTLVVGGPSFTNHSGGGVAVSVSCVLGGLTNNLSGALMDINSLLTSENMVNDGMVYCYDWTHAQGIVSGTNGRFCIENCFMNVSSITGDLDICDASPLGFCDFNMGTIASSVSTCSSGPCPVLSNPESDVLKFRLYPNPAVQTVVIEVSHPDIVFLKDATGRLIESFEITDKLSIAVDHLEEGIYFFHVNGHTERLLVNH